jgi:hypothetical protein
MSKWSDLYTRGLLFQLNTCVFNNAFNIMFFQWLIKLIHLIYDIGDVLGITFFHLFNFLIFIFVFYFIADILPVS